MDSRAAIDTLADDIADTATHIDVATHRLLGLIRAFDHRDGWAHQGALSCAHWLSWRVGMALGAAREKVRVARALGALPLVDRALERGELSYSKVRAMTRVATSANEELLVTMSRCTTAAQLEKLCRLYRPIQAERDGVSAESDRDRRYVTSRPTDDGMVVLHVSAETLTGATDRGDGVPAETCRRLLCDAGVVPMLEDAAGTTIDVGRKTRTIPPALRRALEARDGGCRFPGCSNRRFVDAHHIEHWIHGGATSLANTILLCRRHHGAIHEDGFTLELVDGVARFRDPSGTAIVDAPPRQAFGPAMVVEAGRAVFPGWDGRPVDYGMCVGALGQLDGGGAMA